MRHLIDRIRPTDLITRTTLIRIPPVKSISYTINFLFCWIAIFRPSNSRALFNHALLDYRKTTLSGVLEVELVASLKGRFNRHVHVNVPAVNVARHYRFIHDVAVCTGRPLNLVVRIRNINFVGTHTILLSDFRFQFIAIRRRQNMAVNVEIRLARRKPGRIYLPFSNIEEVFGFRRCGVAVWQYSVEVCRLFIDFTLPLHGHLRGRRYSIGGRGNLNRTRPVSGNESA